MKILVISQQYWPENWRIVDICEELVKEGNSVTVICGLPNYGTGIILPEYEKGKNRKQVHNGVQIIRCYEHGRGKGPVNLFINYQSFKNSSCRYVRKMNDEFDVVILNGLSPIVQSKAGILYCQKFHKKCLMYCMDLWPISLSVGKITNHGIAKPIYDHYLKVSKRIYSSCDYIFVSSEPFISYFSNVLFVKKDKLEYLPQYSEDVFLASEHQEIEHKTLHNFVFAGNVGKAQDIKTIIKAASLISRADISIHIYGDGSELANSKKMAADLSLTNIVFHGRVSMETMAKIYKNADAMLLTLVDSELSNLVVPGKVQTYMAAGKPIICAAGRASSDIIREANCGICVSPGDPIGLSKAIIKLASLNKDELAEYGERSFLYSKEHFSRSGFFARLSSKLNELTQQNK